jgi:DNA-binding protein H-NS
MARSYEHVLSQIRKLQNEADKIAKRRDKAIATVKKLVRGHGLTASDIGLAATTRVVKRAASKAKRIAPKYRGPGGETWTGRGLMPRWLRDALKKGKKREDFLIKKVTGK